MGLDSLSCCITKDWLRAAPLFDAAMNIYLAFEEALLVRAAGVVVFVAKSSTPDRAS